MHIQQIQKEFLQELDNVPNKGKYSFYTLADLNTLHSREICKAEIIYNNLETVYVNLKDITDIALDFETYGINPFTNKPHGIGLSDGKDKNYYIVLQYFNPIEIKLFLQSLDSLENKRWIFHYAKFDLKFLKIYFDLELQSPIEDTMIMSYLLNPEKSKKLSSLANEYLNRYPDTFESLVLSHCKENQLLQENKVKVSKKEPCTNTYCIEGKITNKKGNGLKNCLTCKGTGYITVQDYIFAIDFVPLQELADYCVEDCYETINLYNIFLQQIEKEQNLKNLYNNIEIPLSKVLLQMELDGIFIDLKKYNDIEQEFIFLEEAHISNLNLILKRKDVNYKSSKQLSKIIYEDLGLPTEGIKQGKEGFSVDAESLHKLEGNKFVDILLSYRKISDLRTKTLNKLKEHNIEGMIHTDFNQTVTSTGRLSSSDPNLQNIPNPEKSYLAKPIRELFIPREKNYQICSIDYSQFELRIIAHLSQEPTLLKAFKENIDLHSLTACIIYDLDIKNFDPKNNSEDKTKRYLAKTMNFGLLYGMQEHKMSRQTGMSIQECLFAIEKHRSAMGNVWKYLDKTRLHAVLYGYTETLLGRRRYYTFSNPFIHKLQQLDNSSKNTMLSNPEYWLDKYKWYLTRKEDSANLRSAGNQPIQGTNADLIKVAMIEVAEYIKLNWLEGKIILILQVHDELVFEVHESYVEYINPISKIMTESSEKYLTSLPVEVSVKFSQNWGNCK